MERCPFLSGRQCHPVVSRVLYVAHGSVIVLTWKLPNRGTALREERESALPFEVVKNEKLSF